MRETRLTQTPELRDDIPKDEKFKTLLAAKLKLRRRDRGINLDEDSCIDLVAYHVTNIIHSLPQDTRASRQFLSTEYQQVLNDIQVIETNDCFRTYQNYLDDIFIQGGMTRIKRRTDGQKRERIFRSKKPSISL